MLRNNLIEFECELIDTQIHKYLGLTKIGIGPDASMNAKLVLEQVEELFTFLHSLINDPDLEETTLQSIFNQTFFYITQENLRAMAGWLIDENNIHTPALDRIKQQLSRLNDIAKESGISINTRCLPTTHTQKQCQHDSNEIAFLILNTAIQLTENPDMLLSNQIPTHAINIVRNHARPGGRYYQKSIWEQISKIHSDCKAFLETSSLNKSDEHLNFQSAKVEASKHHERLRQCLNQYQEQNPESTLQTSATLAHRKKNQSHYSFKLGKNMLLFGSAATCAIGLLVYYICNEKNQYGPKPI